MSEIRAEMIIEMMGRPEEHLKQVMKDYLKRLDSEQGISIVRKKTHEPKEIGEKDKEGKAIQFPKGKEMYSTFAEIEIEVKDIFNLTRIVFEYMPSHVEIISPEEFRLQNFNLSGLLTDVTRKMHHYDAIAKNALLQNQMLANRIMQMQQLLQSQGKAQKDIIIKSAKKDGYGKSKSKKKKK